MIGKYTWCRSYPPAWKRGGQGAAATTGMQKNQEFILKTLSNDAEPRPAMNMRLHLALSVLPPA